MDVLGGQTVVVVARDDDDDGAFTDTARTSVTGCSVQPADPSEGYDTGQRTTRRFRVFGPPALAVARGQDVLEIDGAWLGRDDPARLTLIGPPAVWPDENGSPHHVELVAAWGAG